MEIVVHRPAAQGEDPKMHECQEEHGDPGAVPYEVSKILPCGGFLLGFWMNPLLRGEECDEKKDEADERPEPHGHRPAMLLVVSGAGELDHQRKRKSPNDELRDGSGYKAE